MLTTIISFVICSPLLIIGIMRLVKLSDYKSSNLEKAEATLTNTAYSSSRMGSQSTYACSYLKIGTYTFDLDGNTYEFTYTADREHGHLPKKITACYPKGKPQKAFAENHAPFVKEFFNAVGFIAIYIFATQTVYLIAQLIF